MNGHHILQILIDYCIWDIRQRPTTSVCKSTGPQRGNQKQMEGWKEVTTETYRKSIVQWKNDRVQLESKSANRCDWISISCRQTCWSYWLFSACRTGTPNTHLCISLLKQERMTSLLFSYKCSFKMLFLFVWILLLSSTTSLQSWGRFLWATRYTCLVRWLVVFRTTWRWRCRSQAVIWRHCRQPSYDWWWHDVMIYWRVTYKTEGLTVSRFHTQHQLQQQE